MGSIGKKFLKMTSSVLSKTKLKRPFTVAVEGNIGSGKTTFLNYFKKLGNVCVLSEPLEMWRNCSNHNLLAHLYDDPEKWAFTFQSYVQLTMMQYHAKKTMQPIKLMERSIYSARYCFVEKLSKDGILLPPETAVIDEWFKWICGNNAVDVDLIIYLRTTPEIVYDRILKRNRSEEKTVSFQYIKDLHEIHENWLYKKTLHALPSPVVSIDANLDLTLIRGEYSKCESQILRSSVQMI